MSLRALGSLLRRRRLSPRRGIPHTRVLAQAETLGVATRDPPLRSLNTSRDLDVAGGSIVALAAVGGVAALIGILYSNGGDESSLVVPGGKEIKNVKTEELEGTSVVDELAMKARFEEWMKQFGRTYKNEEEKTMRYEIFKSTAIWADKANARRKARDGTTPWEPNYLADWTKKEMYGDYGSGRQVEEAFWQGYLNQGDPKLVASEWYEKEKAKDRGRTYAVTKAEQVGATRKKEGGC